LNGFLNGVNGAATIKCAKITTIAHWSSHAWL